MKKRHLAIAVVTAFLAGLSLLAVAAPSGLDAFNQWVEDTLTDHEARIVALEDWATSASTTVPESTTTTAPATTTTEPPTTTTTTQPTTTTTTSETTTTLEPAPELDVIWSTDFEDGYSDFETSDVYSNSGGGSGSIQNAPAASGNAVAMHINNAGNDSVRLRFDGKTIGNVGGSAADNLPDEAFFIADFYIPEHVSIQGGNCDGDADAWNVFQWKQTYPNSGSGYTRRMVQSVRLRDCGDDYALTLDSRVHNNGTWSNNKDTYFCDSDVRVEAGEWFEIKAYKVFSDDPDEGLVMVWLNGDLACNVTLQTEMTGGDWNDFGPWRRQFTINNYPSANHDPDSHTLWGDNVVIAVED